MVYFEAKRVCSVSKSSKRTNELAMYDMLPPLGSSWRVRKEWYHASSSVMEVSSASSDSQVNDHGDRRRARRAMVTSLPGSTGARPAPDGFWVSGFPCRPGFADEGQGGGWSRLWLFWGWPFLRFDLWWGRWGIRRP